MTLPTQFANLTAATGQQLDNNFNAVGNLGTIPCAVSGSNALTLTPTAGITPTITVYADYMQFSGVVALANSGATTAQIGSLAALPVYKDSAAGPTPLVGGELIANNMFTLRYDSTLNAGSGGWHLSSSTGSGNYLPITGGTVTGPIAVQGSVGTVGFTTRLSATLVNTPSLTAASLVTTPVLAVGVTASSITRIVSAIGTLAFSITSANSTQDQPLSVPGCQVNDTVSIGAPASVPTGAGYSGYVAAAGTVNVRLMNATGATLATLNPVIRATAMGYT